MIPVFSRTEGLRVRTSAVIVAAFIVGAAASVRVPAAPGQTSGAWVTLFDGTNFNNWTMTGNANWRIADGLAEADMPRGFLVSRASYGDFELRADVWTRPESNGGILFRITDARDPGIENGYELNINDTRKDQTGRTGAIVNVAQPLVKFDSGNHVGDGGDPGRGADDDGAAQRHCDRGSH